MATLTYVYADSMVVLGPLATHQEPHCYDLCEDHTRTMTAPKGWELVRLEFEPAELEPTGEEPEALIEAVQPESPRPHLRVVK